MEFRKQHGSGKQPTIITPIGGSIDSRPLRPTPRPTAPVAPTLPPKPQRKLPRPHLSRKQLIISGAAVGVVIVIIIVQAFIVGHANTPDYQTLSPGDKPVSQLGGWKRVSPPESDPVFAYTDVIDGVPINVSQQKLPASFLQNTDEQVAELAKKFNAITKLSATGTTVYLGTSSKGPQSVIFTKHGLLILVKSEKLIKNESWISYIDSLK